tara:strand:+ start:354 stop:1124 length:771 start_codon:yes stop_codon:yes gene_type:complete
VADLGIPLWQLQVATSIGLLGVWIGWRGGMTKMHSFYDLPTATKLLLYGFFAGAVYQFICSTLVLDVLWTGSSFPILSILIVSLTFSLLTMFLLTRASVRRLNGQPTAGWTFGLGTGAMLVVLLVYRLFSTDVNLGLLTTGFGWKSVLFGLVLACLVPWAMAIIGSWQGWHALEGRRFKTAFKAMLLHSMLLVILAFGLTWPPPLLLIPIYIAWGQKQADTIWLRSGLTPKAKQTLTRMQRTGVTTAVRSVKHEEE